MARHSFLFVLLLAVVNTAISVPTILGHYTHLLSEVKLNPADLECESCKVIVGILQQLLLQNATESEIVDIITKICIDLKIEDRNVCTLVVPEFKVKVILLVSINEPHPLLRISAAAQLRSERVYYKLHLHLSTGRGTERGRSSWSER